VHEYVIARKDTRGEKSPLELLIEGIEHTLDIFEDTDLYEFIERNPFNTSSYRRFNPEPDYQHDILLLRSQLTGLHEILDDIKRYR